jgi:hypothetical protein
LSADAGRAGQAVLALAEALPEAAPAASEPVPTPPMSVLVAERHPLRERDRAVVGFAESQPCRCRVGFHLSL